VYREDLTVLEVTIETKEPTIYPFLFTTFCSYSIFFISSTKAIYPFKARQRKIPSQK